MHVKVEHKPGDVPSHQTNIYMQPHYSQCGLRRCRCTILLETYKNRLQWCTINWLIYESVHFIFIYTSWHCLEADIREMNRCLDEKKKKKIRHTNQPATTFKPLTGEEPCYNATFSWETLGISTDVEPHWQASPTQIPLQTKQFKVSTWPPKSPDPTMSVHGKCQNKSDPWRIHLTTNRTERICCQPPQRNPQRSCVHALMGQGGLGLMRGADSMRQAVFTLWLIGVCNRSSDIKIVHHDWF